MFSSDRLTQAKRVKSRKSNANHVLSDRLIRTIHRVHEKDSQSS